LALGGDCADSMEPPMPDPGILTSREVAEVLGVTRVRVVQMVAERKLHPLPTISRYLYFSAEEVEEVAARRKRRKARGKPGESLTWWGDRSQEPPPEWVDKLITVADAAAFLQVTPGRVRELVRLGRLPGLQTQPGRQGSRLMIPAYYVGTLAMRQDYRERRERYVRSVGQPRKLHAAWEKWGLQEYDPCAWGPSAMVERRGLYTTRQAALRLGVTPDQVLRLRRQGELTGLRKPGESPGGGQRWWYFEQQEVEERRIVTQQARRRMWERKA